MYYINMSVSNITSWLKEPMIYLQTPNFDGQNIIIVLYNLYNLLAA